MTRWILFIGIVLFVDFYVYQSVKTISKNRIILILYWLVSIVLLANFVYRFITFDRSLGISQPLMWSFGLIVLSIVPKIGILLVLFGEDVFRVFKMALGYFTSDSSIHLYERREFVSKLALGIAVIPFASILYGLTRGKYNYQVINHTLFFEDLPSAFNGFKLTHISDIHSGSFDNEDKIAKGIELINEQKSDVILFSGDIVNSKAEEMDPWIPHFNKLKAKQGKFSVLGNHDYGEYVHWNTSEEKERNFQAIKDIHPKIGFDLLLNESIYINKDNERIALVGVENWGTRFKKVGDLNKASSDVKKEDFKILLSHDPSHWDSEVKNHEKNFHLTLSGHTHGMQFGIEIPGIKWSLAQYAYKQWAGIYKSLNQYINVNRGFGFLAFPGRVGIWPEITVITLKKK